MSKLKNKIVWITGASSGIGEALAIACSNEGAKLILSSRRENELKRVEWTEVDNLSKTKKEDKIYNKSYS